MNFDIEETLEFDLVVIKYEDRYYVYHNCVTDDYGEVYEEVFNELMVQSKSGIVVNYWELDMYNRELLTYWLRRKEQKGEDN